jgi:ubiquinone biosynthesis protein UbiJ
MKAGTFSRAVATLIRWGGHNRESARRFLSRCIPEEVEAIAAAGWLDAFEDAVDAVLDRLENGDRRQ